MRKKTLVVALALFLSGCETISRTASTPEAKGAAAGTVLGAGAGAALGSLGGKAGKGAAVGAGVGAVIGGVLGNVWRRQQEDLRRLEAQVPQEQMKVVQQGPNLVVRMKDQLLFDTGRADLKAGAYPTLSEIAQILNRYPDTYVRIYGHTDATGSPQTNALLSERRAEAVAGTLAGLGVLRPRMEVRGFGESQPIASNSAPEGRALNRRVDIIISPREGATPQGGAAYPQGSQGYPAGGAYPQSSPYPGQDYPQGSYPY